MQDARLASATASFARLLACVLVLASLSARMAQAGQRCRDRGYGGRAYTICTVDLANDALSLFLHDATGKPFATFDRLAAALAQTRRTLVFAMNAGMYQPDLSPVGLYVEGGAIQHPANTRDGPGNFHLKPNGVFYFGAGRAGVMETDRFLASGLRPAFATQSGPMLVINGRTHPKIQPDGTSLKLRNGVGVGVGDPRTVSFAISKEPVSFHEFASLFRDALGCPNALFLDGTISSLYAPELGSSVQWLPVGPMIGVMEPAL